jgi:hypothetical protein
MVERPLIETFGVTASFGTLELFVREMVRQVYRLLGDERQRAEKAQQELPRALAIWHYNLVATIFSAASTAA